jgi:hypothetical protein
MQISRDWMRELQVRQLEVHVDAANLRFFEQDEIH